MIAEIIDGPLWYFSLAVFVLGVIWKLATILLGKRPVDYSVPRGSASSGATKAVLGRFFPKPGTGKGMGIHVIGGYLFHLGLLALMFFAVPHVNFLRDHMLGFGWTPMPHWAFVIAAEMAFLGLALLWLNRLMNPVSRLISTAGDHVGTFLTFIVMLTGCLALLEGFESLRLLHRFTVELFLIYFPFSALMHAFTFIPSRAMTGAWFGRRGVSA